MHKVNHSALLPYSAEQMFALVDDIERYDEFVPYCSAIEVKDRQPDEVTATVFIKKGPFSNSFTTRNENTPHSQIKMNLVDGPFSSFEGLWVFEALDEKSCKVMLTMDFAFDNRILNGFFGKVFDQVANKMLGAFSKRAQVVYGKA